MQPEVMPLFTSQCVRGSYQLGGPSQRGPAGQISTSGAPSWTSFPRSARFFRLVSVMRRRDWSDRVSSFCVASAWNRKWWGAAVPGDTQRHTYISLLPHTNTLCSAHGKTNSASSFASYSHSSCLGWCVTTSVMYFPPQLSLRGCGDAFTSSL